jgi:NitT/TauT family transport system ATP-binding protein
MIEVPVPRPRSRDQFTAPEFLATYQRLNELIHPPTEPAMEKFPIPRLTPIGDDVE